jgi:hypothetical protein
MESNVIYLGVICWLKWHFRSHVISRQLYDPPFLERPLQQPSQKALKGSRVLSVFIRLAYIAKNGKMS